MKMNIKFVILSKYVPISEEMLIELDGLKFKVDFKRDSVRFEFQLLAFNVVNFFD